MEATPSPGITALAFYPLLRPRRFKDCMQASGLAPGAALVDLNLRRPDHRRLVLRFWVLWFIPTFTSPVLLALAFALDFPFDAWISSLEFVIAFSGVVALAGSIAAATATMVAWLLAASASFVIAEVNPSMFSIELPFYLAAIAGTAVAALRFPRQLTRTRYIVGLVAAPVVLIPFWLLTRAAANALLAAVATIAADVVNRSLQGSGNVFSAAWSMMSQNIFSGSGFRAIAADLLHASALHAGPAIVVLTAAEWLRGIARKGRLAPEPLS